MLKSNDLLISTTNAKPPKPRSIRLVNQTSKDRGENKVELCARSRGSNGKSLLPANPRLFSLLEIVPGRFQMSLRYQKDGKSKDLQGTRYYSERAGATSEPVVVFSSFIVNGSLLY